MRIENSTLPTPASDVDYPALFRLDGKSYVILGSGGGIGEHVSRTIVAMGGRVLCVDINADAVAAVAGSLGMPFVVANAATEEGADLVAARAVSEFGTINGYVDVIGQMFGKAVSEYGLEDWERDFTVNLSHAFLAARKLVPLVEDGSIVHVSSVMASHSGLLAPGYGPAKAALEAWVRQLAAAYGPRGVRVNAVAPGLFLSERYMAKKQSDGDAQALASRPLIDRLGQPHEIAAAIAFLLSPAAGYISGSTIRVDGGAMTRDSTGLDELRR